MDELKNLVIQTLETNGILGQIRAKLRSSVFKVIDNNDPSGKERALHWENPLAQKVLETTESALAADLIREYMEFYRLDYSLSIFIPEANLKQDPVDRNTLVTKADLDRPSDREPLLVQLLKERKSGSGPSRSSVNRPAEPKPSKDESKTTSNKPSSSPSTKPATKPAASPEQKENKASKYSNQGLVKKSNEDDQKSAHDKGKKDDPLDFNDYDDDFGDDDDIDELLPDGDKDLDNDDNRFTESGNAFTGSQSMGMDPSVNTLAMDDYDYVEEVMKMT